MKVLIKGAGDLATGIAHTLCQAGIIPLMTEIDQPTAIRRTVAFAEAVYCGEQKVEDVKSVLVDNLQAAYEQQACGNIPLIIDPELQILDEYQPDVLIEATLMKYNSGICADSAPLVIGMGPGFYAGLDVDVVIETMRGHDLGRLIFLGEAIPNTDTPGVIDGRSKERLLKSTSAGVFRPLRKISELVKAGEIVAYCGDQPMVALIDGCLRGLLHQDLVVYQGMKVGDVDPRGIPENCFTISDKARALGGAVLTAILGYYNKSGKQI